MRLFFAATLALVLVLPASAAASTAAMPGTALVYRAAPGEANDVSVSAVGNPDGSMTVTLTDPGATIAASDSCSGAGAHAVSCTVNSAVVSTDVDALDRDDRVRLSALIDRSVVRGGVGNDTLTGSAAGEELRGGPGNDLIEGGDGADMLFGGGGRDRLFGQGGGDILTDVDAGAPGPDVLDGGAGIDAVSYADRSRPLRVDLRRETGQGQAGENDTIRSVQQVEGGRAGDTLIGGRLPGRLDGGPGRDLVRGGAASEAIVAGAGDRVFGGAGDDVFEMTARTTATIACGRGRDVLALNATGRERIGAGPLVARDCERLETDPTIDEDPLVPLQPRRVTRSGRITFRVPCERPRCRGRLALTNPGAPFHGLGAQSFWSRDRPAALVTVRLPRSVALRAQRRAVELRVRITGVAHAPLVWRLKVRLP